jgi:hypothetical protein
MAYDAESGGDPRYPHCPKCGHSIRPEQTRTLMHFAHDPYGKLGLSGRPWHSECARPHWDKLTPVLELLQNVTR